MKRLTFGLEAVLWTAVLAAALVLVDRLLVGPPTPEGWRAVPTVETLPEGAPPVLVPSYLPESLVWPPARVLGRGGDTPGWWYEVGPREPGGPRLWVGSGGAPFPEALGEAARCLASQPEPNCPPPWHQLSRKIDGRTVWVLATIPTRDLTRIFEGLAPP